MALKFNFKTNKLEEIDDESVQLHAQLPEPVRQNTNEIQVDSFRKALNASPGLTNETEAKAELLNPTNPNVQEQLNKLIEFADKRKEGVKSLEAYAADNPTLAAGPLGLAKEALKGALPALDIASRTLNFFTAREAGAVRGLVRALKGEGTVLDEVMKGISEGARLNIGFGDVLREDLGIPSLGEVNLKAPKFNFSLLTPSDVAWGIFKDVQDGKKPAELVPFGPTLTGRGAVGLVLDILLDPVTYLSFGESAIPKAFAKGEAKSIVRFMNKTVLTDKTLIKGIEALKATKAGHEVLKMLDSIAASKVMVETGQKIKNTVGLFVPSVGRNKDVLDLGLKVEAKTIREFDAATNYVRDVVSPLTQPEKEEMFLKLFEGMKAEREIRINLKNQLEAGTISSDTYTKRVSEIPRIQFANSKIQKVSDELLDTTTKLSRKAGLPDEILFSTYIPGITEEAVKHHASRNITKLRPATFAKKKGFETVGMSKDVEKVFARRMQDLIAYRNTNTFVKTVIRKFGEKDAEKALAKGYEEFFPTGSKLRFFQQEGSKVIGVAKQKPVFLPSKVLRSLEEIDKIQNFFGASARQYINAIDSITVPFKAMVTAVWPAFHFRNAVSNRILRYLNEGWKSFRLGDDFDAVKLLAGNDLENLIIKRADGSTMKGIAVRRLAEKERIISTGQFSQIDLWHNISQVEDAKVNESLLGFIDPRPTKNNFIKAARDIGANIENEARLASFTRALKDGFSSKEAADIAFQGLFDYANLTAFERNVMRRIFPFYTFSRKNLSLQLKTALTNPGRQANVFKMFNEIKNEQLAGMNEEQLIEFNRMKNLGYLDNAFAVPAGFSPDGDEVRWLVGLGLPQEDLMEMFNGEATFFKLNPLAKLVINAATRKKFFGSAVSLKERYRFDEFKFIAKQLLRKGNLTDQQLMDWVNDPNGFQQNPMVKFMGIKAVTKTKFEKGKPVKGQKELSFIADPVKLDILRNTLVARGMSVMRQLGNENTSETEDLMRVLTGLAVIKQSMEGTARSQHKQENKRVLNELNKIGATYSYRTDVAIDKKAKKIIKKLTED